MSRARYLAVSARAHDRYQDARHWHEISPIGSAWEAFAHDRMLRWGHRWNRASVMVRRCDLVGKPDA